MPEPLKNQLAHSHVDHLGEMVARHTSEFDSQAYAAAVLSVETLELKDRINLVADALAAALPDPYPEAVNIVVAVAEEELTGFAAWPLCSFVERHGVGHPDESLAAMETLTQAWSCEFAIRPFLDSHLEATQAAIEGWIAHPEATVRRLASEGTRPLLPWAPRVQVLLDDPQIGLAVLERLRHDPSGDVRRSVANHLNDVSKNYPDLVVSTLNRWAPEADTDPGMVRHGLRTLVKQGHPGALRLLGFTTDAALTVEEFQVSPSEVRLGQSISLDARLKSESSESQRLVVDFVIHHPTANGGVSRKVFKWTTIDLESGETRVLAKSRTIQTASTRRYTAGDHRVDLQVAGVVVASSSFALVDSSPPR